MANITRGRQRDESGEIARREGTSALDPMRMVRDLFRWDPFAELGPLGTRMFPNIEVKESGEGYVFSVDLPGVAEEDVNVEITGNRLTISGERKEEERDESDRFFVYERTYGSFSRTFTMPEGANLEDVKAELDNGVLKVVVPKKAEVQPRKVSVGGHPREGQDKSETAGTKTEAAGTKTIEPEVHQPSGKEQEGAQPQVKKSRAA